MELKYCQRIRQIKISLINDFRGYKTWEESSTRSPQSFVFPSPDTKDEV